MADVRCATCGEPWGVDYLLHDLIHEVEENEQRAREFVRQYQGIVPRDHPMRSSLESLGWKFGKAMTNVLQCACCEVKPTAKLDLGVMMAREAIEDVSSTAEDVASAFEDFGL